MQMRTVPARSFAPSPTAAPERWTTSVPAVLALVFGVVALLAPLVHVRISAAIGLGLMALLLGAVGMTQGTRPGITGRGVAITGVLLGCGSLIVGVAVAIGLS